MKPLDKAVIVISCLIALTLLCFFVKWVDATDGSGCVDYWMSWQSTMCYDQKLYQQTQVIEKQNEQIIKLSAMATCYNTNNNLESKYYTANGFNWSLDRCVSKLVNDTK